MDVKKDGDDYELLVFDIETSGAFMSKNEIIAIGWVFGDSIGNINEQGKVSFKFNGEFEKRCYDEFWKNNLDKLKIFEENALPPEQAIGLFAKRIDEHEKEKKLRVISDFPGFDVAWVNYYFSKYLDRLPLHYSGFGKFRPIHDSDSYARGVMHKDYLDPWTNDEEILSRFNLDIKSKKTHLPDEDAQYIYECHVKLINSLLITK